MPAKRARLYDALALLTVIVVIALDQWTKALIMQNFQPGGGTPFPLVGHYLVILYTHNSGAAFSMLANQAILAVLIALAIGVVIYLYVRMLNSGPLIYKLVFGMIIGGAVGNLIDRALHSGYVVDFISFRIPEINYYFAIFNVADACISVGVFLLFVLVLFGGFNRTPAGTKEESNTTQTPAPSSTTNSTTLRSTEQDAQS
ncbi:MAG TPA: signal peptidase II [Ktedonobacteraceae bacterium]|nr:signal peptidase II [Ktedonobacteraceae bacterium]